MADLLDQPNTFRFALYWLAELGYSCAHIPAMSEDEMRFVARRGDDEAIYASMPTELLGIAHLATEWRQLLCSDSARSASSTRVMSHGTELNCGSVKLFGQQLKGHCLHVLTSMGYTVSAQDDDPHQAWIAVASHRGRRVELAARTTESLLGLALIWNRWGERCWTDMSVPDLWAEIPGEGWDDE